MRPVALGLTSDQIADELHLSERTKDAHRIGIHRKPLRHARGTLRYALAHRLVGA